MCFHAQQKKSPEAVHQHFGTTGPVASGIFNGFSHPKMTVITATEPKTTALHHWGLIPHWSKDTSIQRYTLNARDETRKEKPSFRAAKPCLILADGFFEWQWLDASGKRKQKYLISLPHQRLFAFAGLWEEWINHNSGEITRSCSIVTTQAQGIMKEIHNSKQRMPIVLHPKEESLWLDGESVKPFTDFIPQKIGV